MERTAAALLLPEIKTITVFMEGGLISDIANIPANIRIEKIDYDVEGAEESELCHDDKCPHKKEEHFEHTFYTRGDE